MNGDRTLLATTLRAHLAGRRLLLAIGVGGLALGIVGVAYAAIPSGSGVYTACVLKGVGTIRLIDPSLSKYDLESRCTPFEQQITWNQAGQVGPQGATGPAGPAGLGLPAYVAYVQPDAATQALDVGWASTTAPQPPTTTYNAQGNYTFTFSRSGGLGCAVPTVTGFANPANVTFRIVEMYCDASDTSFQIQTSDGSDQQFLLNVTFTS